jgi:hypothetical protein
MSKADGKSKSSRRLRVATVFTGVAAAAVGVAQTANAQDAAGPAAKQGVQHPGTAMAKRISGSIRSAGDCAYRAAPIDPTWLHISTSSRGDYVSFCFGGKGIIQSPPGIGLFHQCGGNNKGFLVGSSGGGKLLSTTFGPGTTYRQLDWPHFLDVTINGWTGNDKCPVAPYVEDQ